MKVVIKTSKGDINLELFHEHAPVTVANFVNLIERKYYDGTVFHRVIEDFMAQGGDPTGTGMGGPGYQFGDEFFGPHTFNVPGYLAMANAGPNTNGSQFFITTVPTEWLNYKHTIFGKVLSDSDLEIVKSLVNNDKIEEMILVDKDEEFMLSQKEILDQMNAVLDKK